MNIKFFGTVLLLICSGLAERVEFELVRLPKSATDFKYFNGYKYICAMTVVDYTYKGVTRRGTFCAGLNHYTDFLSDLPDTSVNETPKSYEDKKEARRIQYENARKANKNKKRDEDDFYYGDFLEQDLSERKVWEINNSAGCGRPRSGPQSFPPNFRDDQMDRWKTKLWELPNLRSCEQLTEQTVHVNFEVGGQKVQKTMNYKVGAKAYIDVYEDLGMKPFVIFSNERFYGSDRCKADVSCLVIGWSKYDGWDRKPDMIIRGQPPAPRPPMAPPGPFQFTDSGKSSQNRKSRATQPYDPKVFASKVKLNSQWDEGELGAFSSKYGTNPEERTTRKTMQQEVFIKEARRNSAVSLGTKQDQGYVNAQGKNSKMVGQTKQDADFTQTPNKNSRTNMATNQDVGFVQNQDRNSRAYTGTAQDQGFLDNKGKNSQTDVALQGGQRESRPNNGMQMVTKPGTGTKQSVAYVPANQGGAQTKQSETFVGQGGKNSKGGKNGFRAVRSLA